MDTTKLFNQIKRDIDEAQLKASDEVKMLLAKAKTMSQVAQLIILALILATIIVLLSIAITPVIQAIVLVIGVIGFIVCFIPTKES